jgi:hypothetical protein
VNAKEIPSVQETIKALAHEHGYELLVDFQYAIGVSLTSNDLDFFEKVQQVSSLKKICMIEKSPIQSPADFERQLGDFIARNPSKTVVPVSEVHTKDMLLKIAAAKKKGLRHYGIKFRSYGKYKVNLSKFLATLKAAEMFSIVFGVTPRKWSLSNASMLLPPLYFEANAVSRDYPWGGGKTNLSFLCDDWIYREVDVASEGMTDYDGKTRKEMASKTNITYNSALGRIDTLNQAGQLLSKGRLVTKVLMESLFQ